MKWQVQLRKRGRPLPAVDLIIAAQALSNDLTLIMTDEHFVIIKQVLAPELKLKLRPQS